MNFSNLKEWTTPKGNVTELAIDGVKVWSSHTTHSYDTLIESSAATCTAEGYEVYACSCGLTERRTLAALGHSYGTAYVSTEFSTGYGQKCSRCGALKALPATKLSSLGVSSHVYINVGGTRRQFRIIHKGIPSTSYDSSCNGIWLMQVDGYETSVWSMDYYGYDNSDVHSYLNNTYLNMIVSNVRRIIKQVKIPYMEIDEDWNYHVRSGSSGLSAKVFLLSHNEVGFVDEYGFELDGSVLSYFSGLGNLANDRRKMWSNISGTGYNSWWLRSMVESAGTICAVKWDGSSYNYERRFDTDLRPALILPTDTMLDENYNVVA